MPKDIEQFDIEHAKSSVLIELESISKLFAEGTVEHDQIEDLKFMIQNDSLGCGKNAFGIDVEGVVLRINIRDDINTVFTKIEQFLTNMKGKKAVQKIQPIEKPEIETQKADVKTQTEIIIEPLVPEKGITEWRDINVEIVKIAQAFKGTTVEQEMKDLRQKSHRRKIGKEDISIVIGEDVLEIWTGDPDDKINLNLVRFISSVKKHNPDKFPQVKPPLSPQPQAVPAKAPPDKLFWRDIIAGIEILVKAYPDRDYKTLIKLREMIENGEVGQGMHLFLSIGTNHLWIQTKDTEDIIKEKIAVFIGELKQVAAQAKELGKKEDKPLDPALEKTFWRDIEGTLEQLEPAYSNNEDFKILLKSIKKGILGTVKDFHTIIGGVPLDISQSDTDSEMRIKLKEFVRELSKSGEIKISQQVRQKYSELEKKYAEMETQKLDLENRYKSQEGDLFNKKSEIKRLEQRNKKYEDKIAELERQLRQTQSSATRTVSRPYSG